MIKRSTVLRFAEEALGFVLSALLAFAMALVIERLLVRNGECCAWAVSGLALMPAYIAGRFFAGKRKRIFALFRVLSVIISAALAALITLPQTPVELVSAIAMLIPAAILCFAGGRAVPVYPQSLLAASIAVYLLDIVLVYLSHSGSAAVSVCAVADFALCLLCANFKSVFDGSHGAGSRTPAGIRGKNLLLLSGFAIAAFAVAATGIIQKLLAFIITGVWSILSAIWRFIKDLFPNREVVMDIPDTQGEPLEMADVEPGAWKYLVYAFLLALTLICAVLIGMFIYRLIKSRVKRERKRRPRTRRFFADMEDEDEVESTLDLGGFFAKGREGLRGILENLHRKPGFADMKDDSERVRFAFREFKRARGIETETPLELARGESAVLQKLSADYSALRYGGISPAAEGGENARRSITEIKKIRKKTDED